MKKLYLPVVFLLFFNCLHAQNTITTAVPFLNINTDIVTFGKGSLGVTNTGFYQKQGFYHNPALLAKGQPYALVDFNYTPWLRALVPDLSLIHAGAAGGIGKRHTLGFDYTRFNMGEITFTSNNGNVIGSHKPSEYALSFKYSYRTLKGLAIGIAGRHIESDLTGDMEGTTKGISKALDFGLNYTKRKALTDTFDLAYSFGFSVLNMGSKITYNAVPPIGYDFIPTTLKLGFMVSPRVKLQGDSTYLALEFSYEAEKLLVPTPPSYARDSLNNPLYNENGELIVTGGYSQDISNWEGMLQSFYDAPNGASEELQEIIHKFGLEGRFVYDNIGFAALRAGYFHEHEYKGGRQFVTLGLGFGIMGLELNAAYILPTQSNHPMRNTLMLGVSYKAYFGDGLKFFSE